MEEIVAQIIVGGDVATATAAAVARRPVQRATQGRAQTRQSTLHAVDDVQVVDQHTDHRGQILATPIARHKGFAGADRTTEGQFRVKARIVYLHRHRQRAALARCAEFMRRVTIDQAQTAMHDAGQA